MKKIFLLLSFIPVGLFAQSVNFDRAALGTPTKHFPIPKEGYISPVQVNQQSEPTAPIYTGAKSSYATTVAYKPSVSDTIGLTTYDLQTNGAIAKRVQLYPSGQVSAVWIYSPEPPDNNFTTRYSGYNTFSGSSWTFPYKTKFKQYEFDRSGWPSIGEVTTSDGTYEMLTSHYASAGTNLANAGGIYWYINSAVGKTDFVKTIDLSNNRAITNGVLWPRMATSGNKIYMIGTYEDDRRIKGVINPVVYFRYNMSTGKFTSKDVTLPGYDSTLYGSGEPDTYSIDARDSFVAIIIGCNGRNPSDFALWKSTDSGKTFKRTVIVPFIDAPYNFRTNQSFPDTVNLNDGTGSVTLDSKGVAHVTWSPMLYENSNPTAGDTNGVGGFVDNQGIAYWNDRDKKVDSIGRVYDYAHVGQAALTGKGSTLDLYNNPETIAGYGHNYSCFSNTSIDASGNIFVVFSAPHPDDQYYLGWCYRHIYCSVFNASQNKWLPQQDLVQTWGHEKVFATVSPVADSKLHFMFMQDDVPGFYLPGGGNAANQISATTDTMMYQEVSTADLLAGKLGLIDLGINENMPNSVFNAGSIYPNPAYDMLNLSLNLTRSATVTVKLFNMLGEEMQAQNYDMLPSGVNKLRFGLNNLPSGVYLCNISAGGYSTTQRVVVER